MLGVKTGPDSTVEVEAYLQPRMGNHTNNQDATSTKITLATDINSDNPQDTEIPCWSCGRIQLPLLNEDMTCNEILMWEAVSCKTECVGVGICLNAHSDRRRYVGGEGPGYVIEGPSFHAFAVGGEPLELQGLCANYKTNFQGGRCKNLPAKSTALAEMLDPKNKGVLDQDSAYPLECWHPDPSRNENCRYFGTLHGGVSTPPVLQFTNTAVTVLLDEHGVGPLCKGDGLFLVAADVIGWQPAAASNRCFWRGLPRYFNVTLRKRLVKNPYPVSSLLTSLFTSLNPQVQGQPMSGTDNQVEEVRVYSGKEPLPSDPDMVRYLDQFGKMKTNVPGIAN